MDAHKVTENEAKRPLTLVKWLSDHAITRWTHPFRSISHVENYSGRRLKRDGFKPPSCG
jgi:hypothetical protein